MCYAPHGTPHWPRLQFGAVIFFVISLALVRLWASPHSHVWATWVTYVLCREQVTSLGAFAALMDWRGPEFDVGKITIGATLAQCFVCVVHGLAAHSVIVSSCHHVLTELWLLSLLQAYARVVLAVDGG